MITPASLVHKQDPHVHEFNTNGSVAYVGKVNGHFIWNCDPSMCILNRDCHLQTNDEDGCY